MYEGAYENMVRLLDQEEFVSIFNDIIRERVVWSL